MRRLLLFVALGCSGQPAQAAPVAADAEPAPVAASVTAELHTVTADDGHALAVWSKVPAQANGAIVLLHGRTWSGRPDFDLQVDGEDRSTMDQLAAKGWAAYALDLRGYGGTKRDATGWNTPDRAEADLSAVLKFVQKRHGAAPAVLGWSLGSLTAQMSAQRHPELVSALVLYGYPRDPDANYPGGGPGPDEKPAREKTTAEGAAEDFIVPNAISQAAIAAFVEQALAADPIRTDWRASDQWSALNAAKINVPTMVIHGAADPYAPIENQAKLFAGIKHPDRQWVIVAGGDHAAHLENVAPRFIHAVVSFLERP